MAAGVHARARLAAACATLVTPALPAAYGANNAAFDVIAGDRKAATVVLAHFRQLSAAREVRIRPIVARPVEVEILQRMKAGGGGVHRQSRDDARAGECVMERSV
jgi:hypothetical protein